MRLAQLALKHKAATGVFAALAVLALAAAWLWHMRAPQPGWDQEQLNVLASQAGQQGGSMRRDSDPYREQAVRNTLRQHALELQKPWLTYLAGTPGTTQGTVMLEWQIGADGKGHADQGRAQRLRRRGLQ